MKKIKYFALALLVSMVALTGCSKKNSLSPSEAIKKAVNNIQGSKNYKMNMEMSIGMSMGDMSIDMKLNGDIVNDIENGISYTKMSTNSLGQEYTNETYTDIKSQNGKMIVYTKGTDDDSWSKETSDFENDSSNYSTFFESLEKSNKIKELNSDKNNYNYEVTVSASDFKGIADSIGTNSLDSLSALNGDLKIKISIDKETGNYSKMFIDMKDLMTESMKNSGSEGIKISKAEFIVTISDYDKAGEVKIPEEALKTDDEVEISNSFDYSDYDKVLTCKASEDNISSEITFGFNDDKYAKAYEETSQVFDTKEEADELYDELTKEAVDNQFVYAFDNKVSVTIYYEPEEDEKDYSYSDVKAMYEGNGYVCE